MPSRKLFGTMNIATGVFEWIDSPVILRLKHEFVHSPGNVWPVIGKEIITDAEGFFEIDLYVPVDQSQHVTYEIEFPDLIRCKFDLSSGPPIAVDVVLQNCDGSPLLAGEPAIPMSKVITEDYTLINDDLGKVLLVNPSQVDILITLPTNLISGFYVHIINSAEAFTWGVNGAVLFVIDPTLQAQVDAGTLSPSEAYPYSTVLPYLPSLPFPGYHCIVQNETGNDYNWEVYGNIRPSPAVESTRDLIFYYTCDALSGPGGTLPDSTPNILHMSPINDPVVVPTGIETLEPSSQSLNVTNTDLELAIFSIGFNYTNTSLAVAAPSPLAKRDTLTLTEGTFNIVLSGGVLAFFIMPTPTFLPHTTTIVEDTTYYVVVSFNAGTARIYVDSILVEQTGLAAITIPISPFTVGAQLTIPSNFASQIIDELVQYNKEITQAQVDYLGTGVKLVGGLIQ